MKTFSFLTHPTVRFALAAALAGILLSHSAQAANGTWTLNNNGNWSTTGNWSGGTVADGNGSIADFSQLNITANRTVTIDGAVASRTVGNLLIGDTTGAPGFSAYTIAASGGGTLTFNNGGSTALLTQTVSSGANTISAPIILADNLNVTNNNASGALTISGGITGAKNLALNANDAGGITLSTISINNGGTVTNSGSGSGISTISGVIGTNVTGVVQDSATSQLTLSGTNTFTSGVTIKKGTVLANAAAALGTGTVLLGDTSGSADATLSINSFTIANNITTQAGGTGLLTISNNGTSAARLDTGTITLNKALTIRADGNRSNSNQGALLSAANTITGTGDLNLNVTGIVSTSNNTNSPQMANLSLTGPLTLTGNINNVGTGNGYAAITGNITAAGGLNQNSATSMLALTGTNTYSGPTNVNYGVLRSGSAGGLSANSAITVASGATLQITTTQTNSPTLTLSGNGTAYSAGAFESTNTATFAGAIILQDDATVADSLATTTLTLSGGITGSGKNLTVGGIGNVTLSAAVATGSGNLIKEGGGLLTLSAANTFTGLTQINNGTLALTHASALGGGGNITFNGGTLRHSSTNTVDYASRIVNSTGPVAIDTNSQNITYTGVINATNTGGLTKLGTQTLTLAGANTYTGVTAINNGGLAFSSAAPVGLIFIDAGGVLNGNGAYATAQDWLNSGKISADSIGGLALMDGSNVDLTGYANLMLTTATTGNTTYTGTITPAGGLYRLAGNTSNQNLTLSNANALTGSNGLVVGAKNGSSASAGSVILSNSNDLTGATTVNAGTLGLAAAGTIAGSAVTVNSGATLSVTAASSATPVTRTSSLTLSGGTLTVTGNTSANTTDSIGNLAIGSSGNSIVTLTPGTNKNTLLAAGSLTRSAGGTVLFRGTSLGANAIGTSATSTNISLTTPNLVGGSGANTTDEGILVGVLGDTSSGGSGFGSTGGLMTYDTTKGARLISAYKTSITDGQTQLDNIKLASTGTTTSVTVNSATTINSLSLNSTTATGANVQVSGTGTITVNSGVLYSGSTTATTASAISNAIDFNGREGIIMVGGTANLTLSGVLSNTGGNGITFYGNSTNISATLSGTASNTYTGVTTLNGGRLELVKTNGLNAIGGDLVVNAGTVVMSASNQIADNANVTLNGGSFYTLDETINNLTMTNASIVRTQGLGSNPSYNRTLNINGNLSISDGATLTSTIQGKTNVAGTTTLSNGGSLSVSRSQSTSGAYDSVTTLGTLNIVNQATGSYTAINIDFGSGNGQSGGQLVLNGDVTFTGNATNTNTVLIDAARGTGRQGVVALTGATPGNRTFNIGDGAAAVDLAITAPLVDGSGGASGLAKTGAGTLALTGASTYTGATTVTTGTLLVNGSLTGSAVTVATGATLGGSGTVSGATTTIQSGGTLSPGNSPGVATYSNLTLDTGAIFKFELAANSISNRGTDFDGVNILTGGSLAIGAGVNSNLVFNASGSTVDWNNGLWSSNQSWLVFDLADGGYASNVPVVNSLSVDSLGQTLGSVRSGASFSYAVSGGDIYLNYTAVPEPSTWALLAFSLTTVLVLRRRRA